jgi:hypothetical protein
MPCAIVGGLAVATVLTLIFLPALYVAVYRIREQGDDTKAPRPDGTSGELAARPAA